MEGDRRNSWRKNQRNSKFLNRFCGKISTLNKHGQMVHSHHKQSVLSKSHHPQQFLYRSTACSIKSDHAQAELWKIKSAAARMGDIARFSGIKVNNLKVPRHQTPKESRNFTIQNHTAEDQRKKHFVSVANNLMKIQSDFNLKRTSTKNYSTTNWEIRNRDTRKFYNELDQLPFANANRDSFYL